MAFRYYDAEKVINGQKMKDWLKFSMAWWHTLCAEGGTSLVAEQKTSHGMVMQMLFAAKDKMDAGFEFMQKMESNTTETSMMWTWFEKLTQS